MTDIYKEAFEFLKTKELFNEDNFHFPGQNRTFLFLVSFRAILNIWKTELRPKIGIVCGSGLSGLADTIVDKVSIRNGYNKYFLIRDIWSGPW